MTTITATGADTFSVVDSTGKVQEMSGEMLMKLLAMRGSQVCADELQVQMQKSNDVLDAIKEAEDWAAKVDDAKAEATRSGSATDMPKKMMKFFGDHGIGRSGYGNFYDRGDGTEGVKYTADQWNVAKENLQAYIHKMNGQSQMDYIRLQSLTNQNNRLFSLMDSIETKSNQTKSEIIRDMK